MDCRQNGGGYEKVLIVKVPKEKWANLNPYAFPVNINRSNKLQLLRVPGLGHVTVKRILYIRAGKKQIRDLNEVGSGKLILKARKYVTY
jgi:predicted DNA-binding helix-hairpin-helix protein